MAEEERTQESAGGRLEDRLCALLEAADADLRRAAVRVVGALAVRRPGVVDALGSALREEDRRLRIAAVEALGRIGDPAGYDHVVAHLDDDGEMGRRAMEALAAMGRPVLAKLKKRFEEAGNNARRRILAIAARLRGPAGMDLIVRALENGYAEHVLDAGTRMAEELGRATSRDQAALAERLEKFLSDGRAAEQPQSAAAAVDLLGRLAGPKDAERLAARTGPDQPPLVRRCALEALARMPGEALHADLVGRLLGLLEDPDYSNVVAPALHVLENAPLSAAHAAPLLKMLDVQDPSVRRFAVAALGQVDGAKSTEALLRVLSGDNPDLQGRAAASLAKHRAGAGQVATALAQAPDAQFAWVLARILMPHADRLTKAQAQELARAAALWLGPGDPRAEAVISLLRDRHADALIDACLARAKRLKRDRRASEIANLLRPLVRDDVKLPPEVQYELAVAEVVRGKKDVVREARLGNRGLAVLEGLLQEGFPLLTRLKRDKTFLEPADYYLVGSHFAERPFAERAFGGELLRWIVQTYPDDSCAHSAANKLLMEGFPPPPAPKRKPEPKPKPVVAVKKPEAVRPKPAAKKAPPRKPKPKAKVAAAKAKAPAARRKRR